MTLTLISDQGYTFIRGEKYGGNKENSKGKGKKREEGKKERTEGKGEGIQERKDEKEWRRKDKKGKMKTIDYHNF